MKTKTKNKLAKMQEIRDKKLVKANIDWMKKQLHFYTKLQPSPILINSMSELEIKEFKEIWMDIPSGIAWVNPEYYKSEYLIQP